MMNRFFLSTVLLLAFIGSCAGQQNKNATNNKQHTMEKFDSAKYKDWEIDTAYSSSENDKYFKKGDERVRVIIINKVIQVERTNINTPYKEIKAFSSATKKLEGKGISFYDFPIGKSFSYDSIGNLIKEINWDEHYKFSLKELIDKVKREYFIDLEDKKLGNTVGRFVYEKLNSHPFYEVNLQSKEHNLKMDYILIDGIGGEVLYKTFYYLKQGGTPFEDYLEQKNSHSEK